MDVLNNILGHVRWTGVQLNVYFAVSSTIQTDWHTSFLMGLVTVTFLIRCWRSFIVRYCTPSHATHNQQIHGLGGRGVWGGGSGYTIYL